MNNGIFKCVQINMKHLLYMTSIQSNTEYDNNTTTIQMGFRRKSIDLFESVSKQFYNGWSIKFRNSAVHLSLQEFVSSL